MPNEGAVMDALRPFAIPPGDYLFPRVGSMAEMRSPEFAERTQRGPVALMTVMPNGIRPMGPIFVQWFLYLLVVSTLAAHVASRGLHSQARAAFVFHEVALVSFAAYALALWQLSIWYRRAWSITIKSTVDAVVYGAITGGIFAWWWAR
jgi:hypothetical protein